MTDIERIWDTKINEWRDFSHNKKWRRLYDDKEKRKKKKSTNLSHFPTRRIARNCNSSRQIRLNVTGEINQIERFLLNFCILRRNEITISLFELYYTLKWQLYYKNTKSKRKPCGFGIDDSNWWYVWGMVWCELWIDAMII